MSPYLRSPIAFAHRGGAAVWPENTFPSFRGAIELGFRYIETDLHVTRDGVIVCFHDDTLDRTTDGVGRVRELSLGELRTLDAGYRFSPDGRTFPFRGQGVTMPTLEEAFALHPELKLNVEMKQREPRMEALLWDEIDRLGVHDRILVAASHDPLVHRFRKLRSRQLPTSPGIRGVIRFWGATRARLSHLTRPPFAALQVPPTYGGMTVVDRAFVDAAHHLGVHVHCWTIDDREEMHRLLDLGVDGLMTDQPAVLRDVFEERGLPLDPSATS
ncbi:MAG: glycerophosphodiester phosphodiesterase [Sandaracinaceae bacterium]|nr:glycerophosphodiester phosphodiesterase [Sandaracinaceae bacterium]